MARTEAKSTTGSDLRFMQLALSLGARGLGQVAPNPAVGCVIVKDGRIVGRGSTAPGGRPHAERIALAQAGAQACGADVFVSLEPCAHEGTSGACVNALIKAQVGRVVSAIEDPNPEVAGRGHALLKQAGIAVETGLCETQAAIAHRGFFKTMRRGLPMVTLKLASSLDGRIATASGQSQWITNARARRFTHLLRAQHDAILIGSGTALADDPDLRVRHFGLEGASPIRVILDRQLRLLPEAKLFQTAQQTPVWILHSDQQTAPQSHDHLRYVAVGETRDGLDLHTALATLAQAGITRVFCEGGGQLAASLIRADLVDELITFHAGLVLGATGIPALGALGLGDLADHPRFEHAQSCDFDGDQMTIWRKP